MYASNKVLSYLVGKYVLTFGLEGRGEGVLVLTPRFRVDYNGIIKNGIQWW